MEIKLRLPLKNIFVTQPWGKNYFDFYQKMGLPYHPGVDFRARQSCPCHAANGGEVIRAGKYSDGGLGVEIIHPEGWSTFYYHLEKVEVKPGDRVIAGNVIGLCDNTGKYTTGDHLHFELRKDNEKINPAGYFYFAYDGTPIGTKDWDKSRCYHRYYRGRPKGGYWIERYRVVPALLKYLKRLPNNEEINAATYGGWDRETIANPSMYEIWSQLKKSEYLQGIRQFQN